MFGLFVISVLGLFAFGTTVDHCKAENLGTKQCIEYVQDNSVADYSNVND